MSCCQSKDTSYNHSHHICCYPGAYSRRDKHQTVLGKPASPKGDRRLCHNAQIRTLGAQPQLVSLFKCLRIPPTPESRGCGAALY